MWVFGWDLGGVFAEWIFEIEAKVVEVDGKMGLFPRLKLRKLLDVLGEITWGVQRRWSFGGFLGTNFTFLVLSNDDGD